MITRETYLKQIREFYDNQQIKVITGIRRCGKSFILDMIRNEISQKTDNIIYLNFEKLDTLNKVGTCEKILDFVEKNRKQGKCYIFLDEIQEIENWQKAVKDLRLGDNSVFITGSNSKLLSNEFLDLLSGRFVSFRIRPFVYKEIVQLKPEVNYMDYLLWGGFPGRFDVSSLEGTKIFLTELERTIVVNDLINRYKIKKDALFKRIVTFVLSSNSRILSARAVYKYIKDESDTCSINTIIKYISYLKEAYIIDEIKPYSTKVKKELSEKKKIYNADVCFNSLRIDSGRYDLDHNLENIIYNELLYMGYKIRVYDNKGKEIDFFATKDGKSFYVQVAYSVVDQKAYEREMCAFENLDNMNQKILITNDELDYSTSTVRHIKLKDFLLLESL